MWFLPVDLGGLFGKDIDIRVFMLVSVVWVLYLQFEFQVSLHE